MKHYSRGAVTTGASADAISTHALLVCTHNIFPGWAHIVHAKGAYRWYEA